MEDELKALREEVAALRREMEALRNSLGVVHHYHHGPNYIGSPPVPVYQPWWTRVTCGPPTGDAPPQLGDATC